MLDVNLRVPFHGGALIRESIHTGLQLKETSFSSPSKEPPMLTDHEFDQVKLLSVGNPCSAGSDGHVLNTIGDFLDGAAAICSYWVCNPERIDRGSNQ